MAKRKVDERDRIDQIFKDLKGEVEEKPPT
jgi:hypothetical protein